MIPCLSSNFAKYQIKLACLFTFLIRFSDKYSPIKKITNSAEYNSHNTNQLNKESLSKLLLKLPKLKRVIAGENIDIEE